MVLQRFLVCLVILLVACGGQAESGYETVRETAVSPHTPTPSTPKQTLVPEGTLVPAYATLIAEKRNPAVPNLPFADNPDPNQCGIPSSWGKHNNQAWLTGKYQGNLIQQDVLLYDSHLRLDITASAPHGTQVTILLYQQNPSLNYYFVKINEAEPPNEGWIPAPFLSFEPLSD